MKTKFSLFISFLMLSLNGSSIVAQQLQKQSVSIFVSPQGNDSNPGTKQKPLRTIEAAKSLVDKNRAKAVSVFFRGGVYPVNRSVVLTEKDAGTAITLSNYANEKVVFTGGRKLNSTWFKPVSDTGILSRLPEPARKQVRVIDLKKNGIFNYGERVQHGSGSPVQPSPLEVFFNGNSLQIARWPNQGKVPIGKVHDHGSRPRSGDFSNRGALFEFDYNRAMRWKDADDIWLNGVFSYSFSEDNIRVDSIDHEKRTIKLSKPHLYAVYSSTDTSDVNLRHGSPLRGYYVYNLLEEIDMPGEWFLDDKTGKLYIWPPSDISGADIQVSLSDQPFIQLIRASHFTLKGITFETSRGMGVYMENCTNILIDNCVFRNLGTVAISAGNKLRASAIKYNPDGSPNTENAEDDSRNIHIRKCKIYNTGTGGIILKGGNRKTLEKGNNKISFCEIYNFSRINTIYSPAVSLSGVGNTISNCYIHHAPHMAISFSGNDHLIEYNHFEKVCTDASDMGAIYTGRNPSARGTHIRYNFFDDIRTKEDYSVCAVYFDDGSGGMKVTDNLFYKCGSPGEYKFGAVYIHGGHGNIFENNAFINCPTAFSNIPWDDSRWKQYVVGPLMKQRLLQEVDITSPAYLSAYPELKNFTDTVVLSRRANYTNNSLVYNGELSNGSSYVHNNAFVTDQNPGFADIADKDFRFKPSPEVLKNLPGFRPIPFEKIGIQRSARGAPPVKY